MSEPAVTIVDYGMGNLLSVSRAFEHCGAQVEVTDRPERARRADRLVLPGVGAFADPAEYIRKCRSNARVQSG